MLNNACMLISCWIWPQKKMLISCWIYKWWTNPCMLCLTKKFIYMPRCPSCIAIRNIKLPLSSVYQERAKSNSYVVPTTIPAVRFPWRPAMIVILVRPTPDKYSTPIFLCTIYKNESLVMYNLYSELQYAMHLLVGKLPMWPMLLHEGAIICLTLDFSLTYSNKNSILTCLSI